MVFTNTRYAPALLLITLLIICFHHADAQYIDGTDRHASMICADGSVYSWGYNYDALLGDGTSEMRYTAVQSLVTDIVALACNTSGTAALDKHGTVFYWGWVAGNQFGDPSWNYYEPLPKKVTIVSGVRKVDVTRTNAFFLLADSTVAVSGSNFYGHHGNGTRINVDSGYALATIDSVVDILCTAPTFYAARSNGDVLAWGSNEEHQVNATDSLRILIPTLSFTTLGIQSSNSAFGIANGYNSIGSNLLADIEGTVYTWGSNREDQLGIASTHFVSKPTKLTLPRKCVSVAGGIAHSLFLLEDGTVWACGDNKLGQLGVPSVTRTATPVQVASLSNVSSIGAGAVSSYAITTDGTLWGWGDNAYRQLNLDGVKQQFTPTPLPVPCALVTDVATEHIAQQTPMCTPNPVHDQLTVTIPPGTKQVDVVALHGHVVATIHPQPYNQAVEFDLSNQADGMYMVVCRTSTNVVTNAIIKVR